MARSTHRHPASPRRQRGVALLAVTALVAIVAAGVMFEHLGQGAALRADRDARTAEALAEAKRVLIHWAVTHPRVPGRLPYPDRASEGGVDPGNFHLSDYYDGISDCSPVGPANPALRIGRFPWAGEYSPDSGCFGLPNRPIAERLVDGYGEPLWYAVSGNLLHQSGVPVNPGLLDPRPGPWPPYPWLTVRDSQGNVLSEEVAAVIIAPGPPLAHQTRRGDFLPAGNPDPYLPEFLDRVTIGNQIFSNANTNGVFVMHPGRESDDPDDAFNDRLVFITAEELLRAVERRALADAGAMLDRYRRAYGAYPWLSPWRPHPSGPTVGGFAAASSAGTLRAGDSDVDFFAAGIAPGDLVQLVGCENPASVLSVVTAKDLQVAGLCRPVVPGDAYNMRPAYDAVREVHQGHLPFADLEEAYVLPTPFELNWGPPPGLADPATDWNEGPGYDELSPADQDLVESRVRTRVEGTGPAVLVPGSPDGNGVCRWSSLDDPPLAPPSDPLDRVQCRGEVVEDEPPLSVEFDGEDLAVELRVRVVLEGVGTGGMREASDRQKVRRVAGIVETDRTEYDPVFSPPPALRVEARVWPAGATSPTVLARSWLVSAEYGVSGIHHQPDTLAGGMLDQSDPDNPHGYLVREGWHRYLLIAYSSLRSPVPPPGSLNFDPPSKTAGMETTETVLHDPFANFEADGVRSGDIVKLVEDLASTTHRAIVTAVAPDRLTLERAGSEEALLLAPGWLYEVEHEIAGFAATHPGAAVALGVPDLVDPFEVRGIVLGSGRELPGQDRDGGGAVGDYFERGNVFDPDIHPDPDDFDNWAFERDALAVDFNDQVRIFDPLPR